MEWQYRLFVTQHSATKSCNQQVMQQRTLKGKMSKKSPSTADDITGTMAHYPHVEERQTKKGQI